MDKAELRDILFQKYFDIENGVLIRDFLEKLDYIPETWKKLHYLCENNIEYFNSFDSLKNCKFLEYSQTNYLIIKLRTWNYVIIDIDKMENINETEFKTKFNEEFFVDNFDEIKDSDESFYTYLYHVEKYEGNIEELVSFYKENEDVLSLSSQLHCKVEEGNAYCWFHVDFSNANVQMGFQTPDQSLYEQFFFKYDLTPCELQDVENKNKISIDKIHEIFNRVKYISLPIESIPKDLYKQYLMKCNKVNKKLTKKI